MEFLLECMILFLKVSIGSLCWGTIISGIVITLGAIIALFNNPFNN